MAQVRIRSAQDLIEALYSDDLNLSAHVLEAVSRNPQAALAFGQYEGKDVLDYLLELVRFGKGRGPMRAGQLGVLLSFDDPRMWAAAEQMFPEETNDQAVLALGSRLAQRPTEAVKQMMQEQLMQERSSVHARVAAGVLAWWPDWKPSLAQLLRAALISNLGVPVPPPLTPQTVDAWLAEIDSPRGERARRLLESISPWPALAAHWSRLNAPTRAWLLLHGRNAELLHEALGDTVEVARAALEVLLAQPHLYGQHRDAAARLATSSDPATRCLAVLCGGRDSDLLAAWTAAPRYDERQAVLRRALDIASAEDKVEWISLALTDDDWRVRALGSPLAVSLGPSAVARLRELAGHPREEVRAAACNSLVALGDEDWIEARLLS